MADITEMGNKNVYSMASDRRISELLVHSNQITDHKNKENYTYDLV